MTTIFPFTAIVGQEKMKRALVLNAIHSQIGGVLIRGERGTAKSTAVRALAALLPEIEVVADCPFACDPRQLSVACDNCRKRVQREEGLPVASRRTRVIDLPVSATEDRVVGTLDIEKAIKRGEKHFEPGVLAAANRGLLYVDEVNLLDDHVVDLLLDSAAMGVNVVEREGISFSHPAQFILVGTMNPEEGELRPQLLDRFGLSVEISGITDLVARTEILERRIRFERDVETFVEEWQAEEQRLANEIQRARQLLPQVGYSQEDLHRIAQLTADLGVDGHRADITILKAGLAHAAFKGHPNMTSEDILLAAELALPHRIRKRPLDEGGTRLENLGERLERSLAQQQARSRSTAPEAGRGDKKKINSESPRAQTVDNPSPSTRKDLDDASRDPRGQDHPVSVGSQFRPKRLETPIDRRPRNTAGRRSLTHTVRKRGRYIQARPMQGRIEDVAFDATFRQAAPHQLRRHRPQVALAVEWEDLQRKVRVRRASNLVLFVVDASWSMAAAERMVVTKGAIVSLLQDAYQRRDRVGLIVFRKAEAKLLLPPTNSILLAQSILRDLSVGGKTPLSNGLYLAHRVFRHELRRDPKSMPLLILLTDGAGNVSMTDLSPREEGKRMAFLLRQDNIRSVVINTEHRAFDRGLAQELALYMGAQCYTLEELGTRGLYYAVKTQLEAPQVIGR